MIIDNLKNARRYFGIYDQIGESLLHLENNNFDKILPGRYEINGDKIYGLINHYLTKNEIPEYLEAHKKYVDIHYILSGSELISYEILHNNQIIRPYDVDADYILYTPNGPSNIKLNEGEFAIFFPEDLHMPGFAVDIPLAVKKVVIKLLIDKT